MTRNGTLRLDSKIQVFEDRDSKSDWRAEYFDDDGGCYVTIFAGPFAEKRAREYAEALKARKLAPIPNQRSASGSKRKAAAMADKELDRLGDQQASGEERAHRKRHLIRGPQEFRGMRRDQPKIKS